MVRCLDRQGSPHWQACSVLGCCVSWCVRGVVWEVRGTVCTFKTPSVCAFKTSPCVPRHHARTWYHMRAWCRYTQGRFECTHGGFSACQTTHHTTPHAHTHTTTHTTTVTHTTTTTTTTTTHNDTEPTNLRLHSTQHGKTHEVPDTARIDRLFFLDSIVSVDERDLGQLNEPYLLSSTVTTCLTVPLDLLGSGVIPERLTRLRVCHFSLVWHVRIVTPTRMGDSGGAGSFLGRARTMPSCASHGRPFTLSRNPASSRRDGSNRRVVRENTRPPSVRTMCSSDKSLLPTQTP